MQTMRISNIDQLEKFVLDGGYSITDRFLVFRSTLHNFDIPFLVWVASDNERIPLDKSREAISQMLAVIKDIRQSGTTTQRVQITVSESEQSRINIENKPLTIDFRE
jgi:hypothetical protein